MDDAEWVTERIEELDIAFSRPADWDFRLEHDDTYLYWDEDAGSMRVTPRRLAVNIESFLETIFQDHREDAPAWRTVNGHKAVTWTSDSESRSVFVVTGRDDLLLVWSYAYDAELYAEDEDCYAPAVDAGLEKFEEVLSTVRF